MLLSPTEKFKKDYKRFSTVKIFFNYYVQIKNCVYQL